MQNGAKFHKKNGMIENLLVVEFASVLAGPAVGMFFAELGARVIKVENRGTGGDVTRSWVSREESPVGATAYFSAVNWGKESICLDLHSREDHAVAMQLVERADIALVRFKPGDVEKLGLDYPALKARNPRLIYARVSGYGTDDPRTAYDAILQGACGFSHMNGEADRPPQKMPVALIDLLAAHQLKEGILLALLKRTATGNGCQVHTSLLKSGIASLANQATNYLVAGKIPGRMGSAHPNIAPYGTAFRTGDGLEVVLGVGNDAQFRRLCAILDLNDLAEHPHFATNAARVGNRQTLEEKIARQIANWNGDKLLKTLAEQKIPAGPILNMEQVFAQKGARELLIRSAPDGTEGLIGLRSVAFELDGQTPRQLSPPPALDEHGEQIRRWLSGREKG